MAPDRTAGLVPVPGGQLYYEQAGEGPALLLIHSGFLDRRMWDPQFADYARTHSVIRYDLRGFGRSSHPEGNYIDAEDVQQLLDHLNVRHASVIGNSAGARVACDFAAGFPERVSALVLVAGGPADLDPTPEEESRFMDTFPDRGGRILELEQSGRRSEAVEKMLDVWAPRVDTDTRSRLRTIASENADAFFALAQGSSHAQPPSYPVAETLKTSGVRLLSISGEHDLPALNMMMGRYAQQVPGARHLTLADGDHTASLSARTGFDVAVLGFLRSAPHQEHPARVHSRRP
jgi:3-oxoadipate enol-lactonase